MTQAPLKPCKRPGCPATTRDRDGYCSRCKAYGEQHKKQISERYDKQRGSYRQRGYSARWDKVRKLKARQNPLCELCLKEGRVTAVQIVHHVIPVSEQPDKLLYMDNLMSLCRKHHEQIHAGVKSL